MAEIGEPERRRVVMPNELPAEPNPYPAPPPAPPEREPARVEPAPKRESEPEKVP